MCMFELLHGKNQRFVYAKTKAQISCVVTAQLICAFVFVTHIVLFRFYLYTKFQASSFMLSLYSLVCGPGRKPKLLVFSCTGSFYFTNAGFDFSFSKQIKIETAFTNRNSSTTIYTSSNKACDTTTTAPPPSLLKTWTKIIPVVGGERAPLVLDSSDEEAGDDDDLKVPFKDRKLPTYIPLIMKVTGKDGGTEAGSERTKGNNAMSPITRKQSLGSLTSSHTNRPVQ